MGTRRGEGNIMALGKNIKWKKGKGEAIIFPWTLWLLGRISIGEEGKGRDGNLGGENQDFKKHGRGRKSSCRELCTP